MMFDMLVTELKGIDWLAWLLIGSAFGAIVWAIRRELKKVWLKNNGLEFTMRKDKEKW